MLLNFLPLSDQYSTLTFCKSGNLAIISDEAGFSKKAGFWLEVEPKSGYSFNGQCVCSEKTKH